MPIDRSVSASTCTLGAVACAGCDQTAAGQHELQQCSPLLIHSFDGFGPRIPRSPNHLDLAVQEIVRASTPVATPTQANDGLDSCYCSTKYVGFIIYNSSTI